MPSTHRRSGRPNEMEIHLPYGRSTVSATIPGGWRVDVVELGDTPAAPDPIEEVRSALANPCLLYTSDAADDPTLV